MSSKRCVRALLGIDVSNNTHLDDFYVARQGTLNRRINVFVIRNTGYEQMYKGDMNELHYGQYAAEKAAEAKGADEKVAMEE